MKVKEEVLKALELQKEMFGDELYAELQIPKFEDQTVKKQAGLGNLPTAAPTVPPRTVTSLSLSPTKAVIDSTVSIPDLREKISSCLKCPLGPTRKNFVFGEGNPEARLMVIGEGPGADEDIHGKPFVGRAGQLLTDILKAIKFSRDEVFIANIVKCRPPANRTPFENEIESCRPYLIRQIELIKPSFILCLGSTAVQALLERKGTLGSFRKNVYDLYGAKVMATFHPAALLRNPNWKRDTWEDVQALRKLYDEKFPG
ncbi:MAG: uracil-DNA glycosylase [Ignavibacteriales bacterium]|jgi:uracil-DNA glycosylase family 4|nr:uracil-DNA glycosylase [Ignavibacteriales bacterium]MBP9123801.1 uracil-DNA glycosylase [Ignavibacteriaceae bacterium]MCC6637324.1 uracil-DNA glycosylase [Ignavibacteriaceae bacterium]